MSAKGIAMSAAAVLLLAAPVSGEKLVRAVNDVDAIVHESGAGRVLFRADLSTEAEHVAVRRVLVRLPLDSIELSRGMTLRIHPVTTAWNRGAVSWTAGWNRPGGDFEDLVHGRAELAAGVQGEAIFDITVMVKEILEYGAPNRGFILTIDPNQGLGIPATDLAGLRTLSGAKVQVEYRNRPPRPRRANL